MFRAGSFPEHSAHSHAWAWGTQLEPFRVGEERLETNRGENENKRDERTQVKGFPPSLSMPAPFKISLETVLAGGLVNT